ncbi:MULTISPECIES: hypothetical protein [unclassified Myxococcus]|jgi:hypothetical protein|uniref:hypothetical protein n=1 Tax=unclassified Myxococcus TaxID=2648731 RepID=UPI001CC09338|nr:MULTISPECIES: hypothetical protein [unclassified Myxococcus]MBZ4394251.1 hypothetical protein [Myxococcus sp. AS-1-15]MBZ4410343.1 hypothetical protein [Myxococcus sp. XM-1-1-1]BDT37210.1 hypothetical protein MFMH1_68790 [Myxococcus sp. MH1]
MRFKATLLLPLALLALGAMPACSGDSDDDKKPDAGGSPDSGTPDSGTPDSGTPDSGTPGGGDGGTGTASCPSHALFCETFESGQGSWDEQKTHATITADGTKPHTGSRSLHVVTEDGIDEKQGEGEAIARWIRSLSPTFSTQLFVRAHVFMTSLPGDFGQMGTFFVLFSDAGNDFGGFELQVIQDTGFALDDWSARNGQGWNRQGPPVNLGMSTGRWVCLEWEVRRPTASSTHGTTTVYVDGAKAHEFTEIGMRSFNTFMVGYGFVHPQGPSASETWIDNVAVSSTQRIGCE